MARRHANSGALLALFISGMLAGCSQPGPSAESDPADPGAAVAAARTQYEASRAAGHAWRKTAVHLEAAETALREGDVERARAEAQRAVALAEASLAQAQAEADAWKARLPGS